MMEDDRLDAFQEHRQFLFALAYRMLGSVTDTEDLVQETFLRWQQTDAAEVREPRAYLSTVITRLCLNQLKSARARREQYVGPWLPEPLLTAQVADPCGDDRLAESLSMAFLVLLESLSPAERCVFLLREVFDYDYEAIARILGKSAANCRQVLRRARQQIAARRPRFAASPQRGEQLAEEFFKASGAGDMQGLLGLLAEDVALWSDGGGKAVAAMRPVFGADRVARFVVGALRKLVPAERVSRLAEINGQPGIITYAGGRPLSAMILDVIEGRIRSIYIVSNPEKLAGLPPCSDPGQVEVDRSRP
jgi:RNA polymerase sigma-70 factor (ECF subfamily)